MCHYCGYSEPAVTRCPKCGGPMKPVGSGTQKIQEELAALFPDTRVLRMDADTVAAYGGHEAILNEFQEKQIPILLGTQMVAKGLNFENVTLVGVLDADMSLYVDNYRAAETTFSLLTQVVGRSGRGASAGIALIQTMTPEHPVMDAVLADVPCSGLGVIRKKPDIRYKDLSQLSQLPQIQLAILENVSRCVKKGGVLVYSTCTVLRQENEDVVEAFLRDHPAFSPEPIETPAGLKLENRGMILKDGSVKVADFGIARISSAQNTLTREALGSVHYISPEQAKGGHVDFRTDLYSLGVVLYEMLTGRPPFDGDTPVSVAIQHINAKPVMPRELNPSIPLGLEQITMHAMTADLDKRYATATDMLADLEEFRKNPNITFDFTRDQGDMNMTRMRWRWCRL